MATKKKEAVASLSKADRDALKHLGKEVTTLRKAMSGWAGDVSRHEDEVKSLVESTLMLKKKVKRLETDPLYAVPQQLEKKVVALEAQLLAQSMKVAALLAAAKEKKFKGTLAGTESQLQNIEQRLTDVEAMACAHDDALDELVGPRPPSTPDPIPLPAEPEQLTLDSAINHTMPPKSGSGDAS